MGGWIAAAAALVAAWFFLLAPDKNEREPVQIRIHVVDGDTFEKIGVNRKGREVYAYRFRLWGIDAPEARAKCPADATQPCGQLATEQLRKFLNDTSPWCDVVGRDHERDIARCRVGKTDLSEWMVAQGYACDWPRYSGAHWAQQEREARQGSKGLWRVGLTCPLVRVHQQLAAPTCANFSDRDELCDYFCRWPTGSLDHDGDGEPCEDLRGWGCNCTGAKGGAERG